MLEKTLDQLDWPALTSLIAAQCQSQEGFERCKQLSPDLDREAIEQRWSAVLPLKELVREDNIPPIGAVLPVHTHLKAAKLGQVLQGPDLAEILVLLEAVRRVHGFAERYQTRCQTLVRFFKLLYPIPQLASAIDRAIDEKGLLKDDASPELTTIRRKKRTLKQRIENTLKDLTKQESWAKYLQDDFFTIRQDRYVVPMRLDGRGRLPGTILDTSQSGQTLFIEPAKVNPLNQELIELDLAEKLEIIRLFRQLSQQSAEHADEIQQNYQELIELDFLHAQATAGHQWDGGTIQISDQLGIALKNARHPLLAQQKTAIGNDIAIDPKQCVLIISGPNAGGKTVVLKTIGLSQLMLQAGLLIPAEPESHMPLFRQVHLEMGDAQSLQANLSTFSAHIKGLSPIVRNAGAEDLVLLDEIAVGTEPATGSAIAQSILEHLANHSATTLATTHFDRLKGLAINDQRFRNGSMEFSVKNLKPTYRLILDVPGQSYGLEVATEMGLPETIVDRAKELRGSGAAELDAAVHQLMQAREEVQELKNRCQQELRSAEAARDRWERQRDLADQTRQENRQQLADQYEKKWAAFADEFEQLKAAWKKAQKSNNRDAGNEQRRKIGALLNEQKPSAANDAAPLPGSEASLDQLKAGQTIYVIPLQKEGQVLKVPEHEQDPVEVQVGLVKLKVALGDARILPKSKVSPKPPKKQKPPTNRTLHTNQTLDLRGLDKIDAVTSLWKFLDKAILGGENSVIILHGHGTAALKGAIRHALTNECPYQITFRPGEEHEGGDGVTVITLI